MILYPIGYQNRKVSLAELDERHGGKMLPEYRRRLFAAIEAAGGLVGIGGGWRSTTTQAANYAKDSSRFAPPGFSFHETQEWSDGSRGYAAVDIVGVDGRHREAQKWIRDNGHRFGLVDFSAVNSEPWHVQLAEIPKSVREWKSKGRPVPARFDLPTEAFVPVVDVSKWQGDIDFEKLAATGVVGVIARAGNGKLEGRDPRFAEYVAGAHEAGLVVGSYYWVRPFAGDPAGQAEAWLSEVSDVDPGGTVVRFLMLDVEWNDEEIGPEETAQFLRDFTKALREGETVEGRVHLGYSSAAYWNANVGDDLLAYLLDWIVPAYSRGTEVGPATADEWYAWAVDSRKRPSPPRNSRGWDGWQFTASLPGEVYGVSSNGLDGNLVRLSAWQKWTGTVPSLPEPPPAPDPVPDPEPDTKEEVVVNVKLRKLSTKTRGVVPDVKRAQALLNALGSQGLEVDGRFGKKTEKAVRNWQTFFGLEADGIVGPQTWTSLLEI